MPNFGSSRNQGILGDAAAFALCRDVLQALSSCLPLFSVHTGRRCCKDKLNNPATKVKDISLSP